MKILLCVTLLIGLACVAQAYTFHWDLGTETDLAGYRLYMQIGPCLNNLRAWDDVKTVGVQNHVSYTPPTYGIYCFHVRAFDHSDNESKRSNKVQVN